jgi:hydroxypyruvate isomerase
MLFLDLPFGDRVRRIADLGLEVEIWDRTTKDVDALAATGASFSSLTGYVTGTLADPDGAEQLLRTAGQSLAVAERLDCPRPDVHGTGLDGRGLPVVPAGPVTPVTWLTAARTLTRLAALGEGTGRVSTLENLNTAVDHPGTPFAGRRTRSPSSSPSAARTCEIHYPAVAAALRRLGYRGVVALEGWASGDPATALEAFRVALTAPAR